MQQDEKPKGRKKGKNKRIPAAEERDFDISIVRNHKDYLQSIYGPSIHGSAFKKAKKQEQSRGRRHFGVAVLLEECANSLLLLLL